MELLRGLLNLIDGKVSGATASGVLRTLSDRQNDQRLS
jgi:hypothetical protein